MISEDKRKAVLVLHEGGKKKKQIARLLNIDRKTVEQIISRQGEKSQWFRKDKVKVDPELLKKTYTRCEGYVQRVYEILTEEHKIDIGYSTLTRLIREAGIGQKNPQRCHQEPDLPGKEMQQDTSVHKVKVGGKKVSLVCCGLYFRYSKMRYIKFYPSYNRFTMKCFFHEALIHMKYSAERCVIDNTHLAVLHGTGSSAVFAPEMIAFALSYGFEWLAHEKNHSNRKAGKERNFRTVETNFFPGRSFASLEDLNAQAFEWATSRYAKRPQSKTGLIPIDTFELEKPYLIKLSSSIEPPYKTFEHRIDKYGYVAFNANYYWIPGKVSGQVKGLAYSGHIVLYKNRNELARYTLPPWGVRNMRFSPEGVDTNPYTPANLKKTYHDEEKKLRELAPVCGEYLDLIKSSESIRQKGKLIRNLYSLSLKMTTPLFIQTLTRALRYGVRSFEGVLSISRNLIKKELYDVPELYFGHEYENRDRFLDGRFSSEQDPEFYRKLFEEENDE